LADRKASEAKALVLIKWDDLRYLP